MINYLYLLARRNLLTLILFFSLDVLAQEKLLTQSFTSSYELVKHARNQGLYFISKEKNKNTLQLLTLDGVVDLDQIDITQLNLPAGSLPPSYKDIDSFIQKSLQQQNSVYAFGPEHLFEVKQHEKSYLLIPIQEDLPTESSPAAPQKDVVLADRIAFFINYNKPATSFFDFLGKTYSLNLKADLLSLKSIAPIFNTQWSGENYLAIQAMYKRYHRDGRSLLQWGNFFLWNHSFLMFDWRGPSSISLGYGLIRQTIKNDFTNQNLSSWTSAALIQFVQKFEISAPWYGLLLTSYQYTFDSSQSLAEYSIGLGISHSY